MLRFEGISRCPIALLALCYAVSALTACTPNTSPLSNTTGISALNVSNFGQITNDISGNNGLNAGDYRIVQLAMKFVF
jgi:hypothetical protein